MTINALEGLNNEYSTDMGDHYVIRTHKLLTADDSEGSPIRFIPDWRTAQPYWSELCVHKQQREFPSIHRHIPQGLIRRLGYCPAI